MVFAWLRSRLTPPLIVELTSKRLRVRSIEAGKEASFECAPVLSIDANQVIVSVGYPIAVNAVRTYEPFASPAALEQETHVAATLLMFAVCELLKTGIMRPAPRMVLHVIRDDDNAIRNADESLLTRLLQDAGAYSVMIYRGATLNDAAARALVHGG